MLLSGPVLPRRGSTSTRPDRPSRWLLALRRRIKWAGPTWQADDVLSLWSGTAASWVDLHPPGAFQSQALGAWEGNQVGWMSDGVGRASLWSGTAESRVDLHPVGASQSEALAIWDGNQGGRVVVNGTFHAGLWSGTAESFVDLHPAGAVQSEVTGMAEGYQVGTVNGRASLWSGTAASWVNIHPVATSRSELRGGVWLDAGGSRQCREQ